jgi:hypothetical protein
MNKEEQKTKLYWTALQFMPDYANLILKEEIGHKALH